MIALSVWQAKVREFLMLLAIAVCGDAVALPAGFEQTLVTAGWRIQQPSSSLQTVDSLCASRLADCE